MRRVERTKKGGPSLASLHKFFLIRVTSLRRALTSSTSPFRTSFAFSFSFSSSSSPSYIKGFSPNRILRIQYTSYLTCSFIYSLFSSSYSIPLQAWVRLSKAKLKCYPGEKEQEGILSVLSVVVISFIIFFTGFWFSFLGED